MLIRLWKKMSSSRSEDHICSDKKKSMKIIMPRILKTLLSFCEYYAFDSNLAIFHHNTPLSIKQNKKHSLLHKNAMCSKSNHK
jgi:hypothetical protein